MPFQLTSARFLAVERAVIFRGRKVEIVVAIQLNETVRAKSRARISGIQSVSKDF